MSTFVLAHLSDPHLPPLPTPTPFELAGKRIGGYINWHHNRRHFHQRAVLDEIVADLKAQASDHIAVTGDLVNLSLAAEFEPARAWLAQLGDRSDVTVVPGNHDTYVLLQGARRRSAIGPTTCAATGRPARRTFRSCASAAPVALIGVTTAVPTLPFRATGRVGEAPARASWRPCSTISRPRGAFRVVLIHHPPRHAAGVAHRAGSSTASAFIAVLRRHGAELVLHGHEHLDLIRWFETPHDRCRRSACRPRPPRSGGNTMPPPTISI